MSKKAENYLLVKTDLGQVKKGFHELPAGDHTYGKAPTKDKFGAREVIGSWEEAKPTPSQKGGNDYISMNREGIKSGCIDSKKLSEFRKNNEIKVKVKEGQKLYGVQIPNEEFVYGVPNRPSTPIKNVICNTYAKEEAQLQAEREAVIKMLEKDQKGKKPAPRLETSPKNKEDVNKKQQIEANNFKLSKFKNVESKIKPLMEQGKTNGSK